MILSFVRKFLFVKTRKTGGTSVEIALSRFCGDQDIISLVTPIDEYLRIQEGRPCQNFLPDRTMEKQYLQLLRESNPPLRKVPSEIRAAQVFYNHMPISEICAAASVDLRDFFKFTIERHPYEKAVSFANFNLRYRAYTLGEAMRVELDEIVEGIDRLIESGKLRTKIRNFDLYTREGKVAVDKIIRYERLQDEYSEVMRDLGLPQDATLPAVKVGLRDKTVSAREILTSAQKSWIQEVCAEEFDLMGYSRE